MKPSLILLAVVSCVIALACGGATAERAKEDVKGAGSDVSNGVGTNGKGIENGVGTKTTGGTTDGGVVPTPTDKK